MKKSLLGWILLCILSTVAAFVWPARNHLTPRNNQGPFRSLGAWSQDHHHRPGKWKTISTVADSAGSYSFAQIAPAKYTIVVTASGFGDQTKTAELLVNQPATIDFALTVEASTVTVDVSAAAQTLNITDASLGNSTNNAIIQALPSETRNMPDLLSLQPGVIFYLPP